MIIDICNSSFEIDSLTGKANDAEKAIHLVRQISEGIYKDLVVEKIAKHYGVPTNKFMTGTLKTKKSKIKAKGDAGSKRPTLVHQAIKILLNEPSLAIKLNPSADLKYLDIKGIAILKDIIDLVENNHSIKVATIIHHFEDDRLKNFLAELAVEEILVNPEELEKEFNDIVLSLKKANQRKELNSLLKKVKNKSLSKSDEERLAELTNIPKN